MPTTLSVSEFLSETKEDINSPTTSTFVSKMVHCRQAIQSLEETLGNDLDGLSKMKKSVKSIQNSGNNHVDNEMAFSKTLEKLGQNALDNDQEPDIGAAFIKFSVVTKELSALMKTLMQNQNNIIMFPLENLLKGDLKDVKGDMRKPYDKAWKDYETKYAKLEKEKKMIAKEAGLIRTEITPGEVADEMEKERKMFQLQMCEYLLKVNEIKTKKGVELLQHLVEYYHAQTNYFQDGLKTIEHFNCYVQDLASKLQKIKQKQDEERKKLLEIRALLKNSNMIEKEAVSNSPMGYSLHQLQGNKQHGCTRIGYLHKKSEGKMRKVWQKRRCEVKDGFLSISHSDEAKQPNRLNLLTCQMKLVPEDKKCFDLISYNRTYHFMAEDEVDQEAWMSVLINSKEGALMKEFDDNGRMGDKVSQSLVELQQAIIRYIQRIPGNDRCCDCNSQNDATWLSTNFGIILCIECSGIHRDLGVHVSRIQSLTLDHISTSQLLIARVMGNTNFNEVMEDNLTMTKLTPCSSMEERFEYIRAKYLEKKFAPQSVAGEESLEKAILSRDIHQLLARFASGADISTPLPNNDEGETALHFAIAQEDGSGLHLVDFLVQNSSCLDKQTKNGSTPLHYCVRYNQTECLKLLLRSGANPRIENHFGLTPLSVAREQGHEACEELLVHALEGKKQLFDNVDIEWALSQDDGFTDFSDDDTVIDDKEEKLKKCRPQSYAGGESPITQRSRSTTGDSLKSSPGSLRNVPIPTARKSTQGGGAVVGSLKKRTAPAPPPVTSPSTHCRTPSDPFHLTDGRGSQLSSPLENYNPKPTPTCRTITVGSNAIHLVGAKLVMPPASEFPLLRPTCEKSLPTSFSSLQRPKNPPPPTPSHLNKETPTKLINGRSTESLSSVNSEKSDLDSCNPLPPPRKRNDSLRPKRCRALYDCIADNEDELSFHEGEVIIVLNEETDDDNWMEGVIEDDPSRKGVFPMSFVHMLND